MQHDSLHAMYSLFEAYDYFYYAILIRGIYSLIVFVILAVDLDTIVLCCWAFSDKVT